MPTSLPARRLTVAATFLLAGGLVTGTASAETVLNVSFARQNAVDAPLFANFVERTGIRINLVEAKPEELVERARTDSGPSPVDVVVTVDVGRLRPLELAGVFQPVSSLLLEARIPEALRHPDGLWFGLSTRARVIYHDPAALPDPPTSYAALADPRYRGMICIGSGRSIYNVSLLAFLVERDGEAAAEDWARGVLANLARPPKGPDSAQLLGVAAGECAVAVANHYYYVRMRASDRTEQREAAAKLALVWPDQDGDGTQLNVTGGGVVRNAANPEHAVRFLEYLVSESAQAQLSGQSAAYPVVAGVPSGEPLMALGAFRASEIVVADYGRRLETARAILGRVGWD